MPGGGFQPGAPGGGACGFQPGAPGGGAMPGGGAIGGGIAPGGIAPGGIIPPARGPWAIIVLGAPPPATPMPTPPDTSANTCWQCCIISPADW